LNGASLRIAPTSYPDDVIMNCRGSRSHCGCPLSLRIR